MRTWLPTILALALGWVCVDLIFDLTNFRYSIAREPFVLWKVVFRYGVPLAVFLSLHAFISANWDLWYERLFLRTGRLEKIKPIALGTPIDQVVAAYGDPIESKPCEDIAEATTHTFSVGDYQEAVITELHGKASSITYWSARSAPISDLRFMMKTYGEGIGWREVERGYWYWRKDGKVRLWCSAIPAIGVATLEHFEAKRAAPVDSTDAEEA